MSEDFFDEEFEADQDPSYSVPNPDDRIWRHPSEVGRFKFKSPKKSWYRRDLSINLTVLTAGVIVLGTVLTYLLSLDMQSTPVSSVKGSTVSVLLNNSKKNVESSQIQYGNVGPSLQNMVSSISPSIVSITSLVKSKQTYSTGVVIDTKGDVLVSAGAVSPGGTVTVLTENSKILHGVYIGSDTESGLGLVKVPGLKAKPISLAAQSDFITNAMVINICREHVNGKLDVSISKILDVNKKEQVNYSETTVGLLVADPPVPDVKDGGVLVDSSGNLVGIENMLAPSTSKTKDYSSTEVAKWVIGDLESTGDVDHGWLGIEGTTVAAGGVQINGFLPNSPCQSVGLKTGDVIVGFNGSNILSLRQLQLDLFSTAPNQVVTLKIERGSQTLTYRIALEAN